MATLNDLHRCTLIGAAIGISVGSPLFWIAPTWVATLAFWLPIMSSLLAGPHRMLMPQPRRHQERLTP